LVYISRGALAAEEAGGEAAVCVFHKSLEEYNRKMQLSLKKRSHLKVAAWHRREPRGSVLNIEVTNSGKNPIYISDAYASFVIDKSTIRVPLVRFIKQPEIPFTLNVGGLVVWSIGWKELREQLSFEYQNANSDCRSFVIRWLSFRHWSAMVTNFMNLFIKNAPATLVIREGKSNSHVAEIRFDPPQKPQREIPRHPRA
jgi:hypothetical protein